MTEFPPAVIEALQKNFEEDVIRVQVEVQAKFRETGSIPPDYAVAKWLEVIALLSVPSRMRKRAKAAQVSSAKSRLRQQE